MSGSCLKTISPKADPICTVVSRATMHAPSAPPSKICTTRNELGPLGDDQK
jgi:hypothetical protein